MNISQQEIEDIKYYSNDEDDTGPKSSHYYYLAENTDGTGGVVGTDANGEEITDYNLLDNANAGSTLSVLREDYETSSTTTRTVTPVGDVNMQNSWMVRRLRSIRQQIRHRQRILTHRKWSTCLPVQPV